MSNILCKVWVAVLCIVFCNCSTADPQDETDGNPPNKEIPTSPHTDFVETPQLKKIKGNSIQIDPDVLLKQGISPQQLVADLKMANIKSVHFFIVNTWEGQKNDQLMPPAHIKALKEEGIAIWVMLLGNCIYGTSNLPAEWEMGLLKPYPDPGLKFYSFHHPEFVKWQVQRVKNILGNYDIDGVEFAESYFPEWKTIDGNGFYGDVSTYALKKFTAKYVGENRPTLTFEYIKKDPSLYTKWMDFRVDAIIEFNKQIQAAIKETRKEVLYAAWGMGMRRGTLAEIREHYGLDMLRIVKEVQPDVFVLQTSAQDWGDPKLPVDYLKDYAPMAKAIQEANARVALSIQADIVSLGYSNQTVEKRYPEWWLQFYDLSLKSGYYTNTAYEYAFAKKDGIWLKGNVSDLKPRKLYKEASLQGAVLAESVVPLSVVREQGERWKLVYTEKGLGWFYID